MIPTHMVKRVCVCHAKVDFKKAHSGLFGEALLAGLDPDEGDLVVFVGRRKDRIKLLFLDDSGSVLLYKRFHSLRLRHFRFLDKPEASVISFGEVSMLLEGTSLVP